jgi:hypothetical protein
MPITASPQTEAWPIRRSEIVPVCLSIGAIAAFIIMLLLFVAFAAIAIWLILNYPALSIPREWRL